MHKFPEPEDYDTEEEHQEALEQYWDYVEIKIDEKKEEGLWKKVSQ
jgi:hypothetical protein